MAITSDKRRQQHLARIAAWPKDLKKLGITKVARDDFADLQKRLVGHVALPGDPDYYEGSALYPAKPKAVVLCEVFADVRQTIAFAQRHKLWVTCRSGGHSTGGWSVNDGLVIDTSRLSYVAVDPDTRRARVGAGTSFTVLNSMLDTYHLHVPGGTCPDVCVAGFMQGGGYGLTSREYGVGCDNIVEVKMALANGKIVVANAHKNADLYWAVRGGTGDQFGVLLELTFELQPLREVFGFALAWPIEVAPKLLALMQAGYMAGKSDEKLGYLALLAFIDDAPVVLMIGMYDGGDAQGVKALSGLTRIGKPKWLKKTRGTYNDLNESLFDVLPGPGTPGTLELKEAHYISKPVGEAGWKKACDYFCTKSKNNYNIAVMEPYGGRINARPTFVNAFVHRDATSMNFFVDSFWNPQWQGCSTEKAASTFLGGFMKVMADKFDGHTYQNYPQRGTPDYRWMYWGDAFNSLLFVKQKYDPEGFFRFEQSITPYPKGGRIHRSTVPSMFHDPVIEYEPWS